MASLRNKKCASCENETRPLKRKEALTLMHKLPGWKLAVDAGSIRTEYRMKDFLAAVGCIRAIARVAESQNHHPDLHLTGYRNLAVELSTHAIGGLSQNDFIVAAKIAHLPKKLKK